VLPTFLKRPAIGEKGRAQGEVLLAACK